MVWRAWLEMERRKGNVWQAWTETPLSSPQKLSVNTCLQNKPIISLVLSHHFVTPLLSIKLPLLPDVSQMCDICNYFCPGLTIYARKHHEKEWVLMCRRMWACVWQVIWKGLWREKECLTVINLCENECRGKIARYTKVSRRVDPSPSLMTSGKADVFWRRAAKMTRDTDAPLNRIPGDLSQALVPSPPIFCLFSPTFPHFPSPFFTFAHST